MTLKNNEANIQLPGKKKYIVKSLLICMPFFLLSLLINSSPQGLASERYQVVIATVITLIFINLLFFRIVHTGITDKYRSILFGAMVICFIFWFGVEFYEKHGRTLFFSIGELIHGEVGYCHLAIPNTIIPMIVKGSLITPARFEDLYMMLFLVLGVIIYSGRAWCGWICFFALEDVIRIPFKKKKITLDRKWIYLSFAVLVSVALLSLVLMYPVYCAWLCPFQIITELPYPNSPILLFNLAVVGGIFFLLVIIIPLITKKRGNCAFLCPFGAMLGCTNPITPFDIRIDKEKCVSCKRCIETCPFYAIDETSIKEGRTHINCAKCGKCVDVCAKKAISFHIKGTAIGTRGNLARILMLYPIMIIYTMMGGEMIVGAVSRLLLLVTTGSMLMK